MKNIRSKKTVTALAALLFAGAIGTAAMAQQVPGSNPNVSQTELRNFNLYLDRHPQIAQRLAANPQLANNPRFLANHPGFQKFLTNHPGVARQIQQSPGQFLNREGHYEWNHGGGPIAAAPGTAAGPLARFDNGYLDQHPGIARQLAGNPGLADSPQFLANHPGLNRYLANHPAVRQELQQHPERFMHSEMRDDRFGRGPHPFANTDRYLDHHPEVAEQLERHPGLIDNPRYLANHPGLDEFQKNHPDARARWQSHPRRFMRHENRYDRRTNNN